MPSGVTTASMASTGKRSASPGPGDCAMKNDLLSAKLCRCGGCTTVITSTGLTALRRLGWSGLSATIACVLTPSGLNSRMVLCGRMTDASELTGPRRET